MQFLKTQASVAAAAMAVGLAALVMPGQAQAIVLSNNDTQATISENDVGEMFDVLFTDENVTDGSGTTAGIWYTITAFDTANDFIDLNIMVMNTTNPIDDATARLVFFGFDLIAPPASDANVTANNNTAPNDAMNWEAALNQNFPGGFNSIDLCFRDDSINNNCTGGASTGLTPGEQDEFDLRIDFNDLVDTATFTTPVIRFQSTGPGQDDGGSLAYSGTFELKDTPMPEPGTLGVLGIGLAGLGWMARRRRKAA